MSKCVNLIFQRCTRRKRQIKKPWRKARYEAGTCLFPDGACFDIQKMSERHAGGIPMQVLTFKQLFAKQNICMNNRNEVEILMEASNEGRPEPSEDGIKSRTMILD